MPSIPPHSQARFLGLLLVCGLALACRTVDLITGAQPPRPTVTTVSQAREATATRRPSPTAFEQTEPPTDTPATVGPTELPPPTELPAPPPTLPPLPRPVVTRRPGPAATPTPSGPTVTPAPTRCPQTFCVVYRGCHTDGNTVVEGIVYNNGTPENGVSVRVAKSEGAYPLVDDFLSGSDPVNPGKPDKNNPGRYILQIVAGAPREGNWWVFVVDRPNGTKQLSEAKLIHTNDDPNNSANCQHAFVDFIR
jgi:hypothetical protein